MNNSKRVSEDQASNKSKGKKKKKEKQERFEPDR